VNKLAPDQVLGKILSAYMEMEPGRVVIYNQDFEAPRDPHLYITISLEDSNPLGIKHEVTDETETASAVLFHNFAVEVVSRNREAIERKEEVLMALHSQLGLQIAEEHNVRLWRNGRILDLSAIEGASALSRYRINVVMSSLKEKQTPIDVYEHFPTEETVNGA
jgi:hypothetical protein